jgi:hypothetical protein
MKWVYKVLGVLAAYSVYSDYMERVNLRAENELLRKQLGK